ncbi:MAG: hypothetical protein U0105_16885 [Candidatus Obscuribacterales bacterium]
MWPFEHGETQQKHAAEPAETAACERLREDFHRERVAWAQALALKLGTAPIHAIHMNQIRHEAREEGCHYTRKRHDSRTG